jgi:hypothetical protein
VDKRDGGRFGRLFGRGGTGDDDETVALAGNDDHAWWADRRSLSGAPPGARPSGSPEPDVDEPQQPEHDPWSAEALFADAGFDPTAPAAEPCRDDGTTTLLVDTGPDEARLVLGVGPDVTWNDITKAHRTLAFQFHPDRLGNLLPGAQDLGQQRMAEINRAYDVLRDHYRP